MEDLLLSTVIQKAIESEIASYELYRALINMVKEQDTKDTLSYLASEELKHREFLENYLAGKGGKGVLDLKTSVDYKVAEYLEAPAPTDKMRPQDAFLLAAGKEKKAHELYESLAAMHPEGPTRDLLKRLAREELGHKEKVEYLYANTAFPQTDGG
jgi:rubrerythrin